MYLTGIQNLRRLWSNGGFDVVIGNPPYVRQELLGQFKEYFESNYKVYQGVADLYSYFIERAVNLLKERWILLIYSCQ